MSGIRETVQAAWKTLQHFVNKSVKEMLVGYCNYGKFPEPNHTSRTKAGKQFGNCSGIF